MDVERHPVEPIEYTYNLIGLTHHEMLLIRHALHDGAAKLGENVAATELRGLRDKMIRAMRDAS